MRSKLTMALLLIPWSLLLCGVLALATPDEGPGGLDLPIGAPKRGRALSPIDPPAEPAPPRRPLWPPPRRPGETPQPLPEPPPRDIPTVPFFDQEMPGASFVFVLDKSGSMQRGYDASRSLWTMVRDETERALDAMEPTVRFSIVVYSYESAALWPTLRPATLEAKNEAKAWLRAIVPGGGTLTGEHTSWALYQFADAKRFLLLSDGLPRDATFARQLIRSARGPDQVVSTFAVAMDGSGAVFMRQVATENGGTYTEVR